MNALGEDHTNVSTDTGKVLLRGDRLSKVFCDDLIMASHYAARDMLFGRRRLGDGTVLRPHEFYALRGVSLEVRRGEIVGILGASQSGKTALTSLLGGLLVPDEGKLETFGRVLLVNSITSSFKPMLTLRENVRFRMILIGASSVDLENHSQRVIEFAGLNGKESIKLHNLHPEEVKRVGMSILLHTECDLLIFDELPSAPGNEAFHQRAVVMMQEFLSTRGAVIATRKRKVLDAIADRVLVLDAGEVIFEGSPKEASVVYSERMGVEKRGSFSLFVPSGGVVGIASTTDEVLDQGLTSGLDYADELDELDGDEIDGRNEHETEEQPEHDAVVKPIELARKRKARGTITEVYVDGLPITGPDLLSFDDHTSSREFKISYTVASSFQCAWARISLHQPRSVEPMTFFTLWDVNDGADCVDFTMGVTYVYQFNLEMGEVADGVYGLALMLDRGDRSPSDTPDLCKIAQVRKGVPTPTAHSIRIYVKDLSIVSLVHSGSDNNNQVKVG